MNVTFLIVALAFIAFDVVTGWTKALATHTTDSSIMREGLFHKMGEILAILFGYGCQYAFPYVGITVEIPIVEAISIYIILMETASIVENLGKINPNLGKILDKVFRRKEDDK